MNTKRFLIASILVGSWAAAQTDGDYAPPRTEWDQPDLQGFGALLRTYLCSGLSVLELESF